MPNGKAKPTIEELEMILEGNEDTELEILPNGEIRVKAGKEEPLLGLTDMPSDY